MLRGQYLLGKMFTPIDSQSNSSRLQILIVEDDPMMQMGLEQVLGKKSEWEIVGFSDDGYLAIEDAIKLQPNLAIVDIGLPRLDGIAVTQKIKEILPQVRVVILTSHTDETEVIAALASGADAYCIKGVKVDRLLTAIAIAQDGGVYLDPQIARQVVNNLKSPSPQTSNSANLSSRELEVLKLIVEGYSNPEIAARLYLSTNTVKTHVKGIMNKLAVSDRVQAAVIALRSGLL